MMKTSAVVVGAGASGVAAARLLAWRGADVTLIDGADVPGGEWNPYVDTVEGQEVALDRGIRIAMASGDDALDDVLYRSLPIAWHRIMGFPNEAHVLRGQTWQHNQCPDARVLGPEVLARGIEEMRRATPNPRAANLKEHLDGVFGPTFTEAIYRPFLQKVYGHTLEALAPGAERYFIPARLILGDEARAAQFLAEPALRSRVAHPSSRVLNLAGRSYFHPVSGPMGQWIRLGIEDLRARGATLRFGRRVTAVHREERRVTGITLDDGTTVHGDVFAWAGAVPAFLTAARVPVPAVRPVFRELTVVHLAHRAGPQHALHYASFYDADDLSHRARFYREGRPSATPLERRMTSVEVVEAPGAGLDDATLVARVHDDLQRSGIIAGDDAVTWSAVERFPKVFPVPTPDLSAAMRACEAEMSRFANVAHVGRTADAAFLDVILRRCDSETARLLGASPFTQRRSAA